MGKKKGKLSAVLGATAGGLTWALAVLLLNRVLGWPDSWPTLVATGGLAFLASALVSKILRKPWAAHAGVICALALLVACPLAGWPFKISQPQQEGYETRYAYFITYILGTEDNGPIENVSITYLCPNIDNKWPEIDGSPAIYSSWKLYYLADNGDLLPQVQFQWNGTSREWEFEIYQFYGERGAPPAIIEHGVGPSSRGPVVWAVLDRIYPREVLWKVSGVDVPADMKENLTLRMAGSENISWAHLGHYNQSKVEPYDKKIHVRFVAQLWKPTDKETLERIEFYQREVEFHGEAGVRLFPAI